MSTEYQDWVEIKTRVLQLEDLARQRVTRLDAFEATQQSHQRALDALNKDNQTQHRAIEALLKDQQNHAVESVRREEQGKRIEDRFNRVEGDLSKISNSLTKIMWIMVTAFATAFVMFIVKGGLTVFPGAN